MHSILPDDPRFKSMRAFKTVFPSNDLASFKQLNVLKKEYTIRFLKSDVLKTFDKNTPLSSQKNCLPEKNYISPRINGEFTMLPEQATALDLLMKDDELFHNTY